MLSSGVRVTGREIGRGEFGAVVEVEINGLRCAAKKLHRRFLETSHDENNADITSRFLQECLQHSRQRHPNIVQLLGVHFPSPQASTPLIVMELMEMSLSTGLVKYPKLPITLKNEIMIDVGQGLLHLHSQSPPIIHRDLTANNVLLTSQLTAKIADLGVTSIYSPSLLSKQPRKVAYMPPEALSSEPPYSTKFDVFSFGVLTLHVFTNKWPLPTDCLVQSADNPEVYARVSEVNRRRKYLEELGENHPHRELVCSCLHNEPGVRPETKRNLASLRTIAIRIGSFPSRIELVHNSEKASMMSEEQESSKQHILLMREKLELSDQVASLSRDKQELTKQLAAIKSRLKNTQIKCKECSVIIDHKLGAICNVCSERYTSGEYTTLACNECSKVIGKFQTHFPEDFVQNVCCESCAASVRKKLDSGEYSVVTLSGQSLVFPSSMKKNIEKQIKQGRPRLSLPWKKESKSSK